MMTTMMVVVVMMAREMHGKAAIPQAGSRRSVCTSFISLSSKAAPTSSSPSPFVVVVITIMFSTFVFDDMFLPLKDYYIIIIRIAMIIIKIVMMVM